MEQNILTTVLALLVYLSSALFGGGGETTDPHLPPTTGPGQAPSMVSNLPSTVAVSAEAVSMRSEPVTKANVIRQLQKGTVLTVQDEKDGWYQVTDDQGSSGWIVKWAVKPGYVTVPATLQQREIFGYYAESYNGDTRALSSFTQNTDTITSIAPFFYRVEQNGKISGQTKPQLIQAAKGTGTKILAVVTNIDSSSSFNKKTVSSLLRNKSARSTAIREILNLLKDNGYSGVNIDFEGVPPADRPYLTAFLRELAATLRANNLLVTAALPAKTAAEEWSAWSGAYDYEAIAPYLDLAVLMTYDQHYAGGPAGPVASQPWVDSVLTYALRYFAPQKLVMGIAAYGYDWNDRSGRALNHTAIQSLIKKHKVTPEWHEEFKTPYFTYTEGGVRHEVWYENRRSTAAKLELVKKYNLRGVAIWRLGYEDPEIWGIL
ncbi:MAG: SH3 domain-containing protein [Firmicutes bacterium]|nr:SH3 domain-containing protein [Bacillota bacterium]